VLVLQAIAISYVKKQVLRN